MCVTVFEILGLVVIRPIDLPDLGNTNMSYALSLLLHRASC